MNFYQICKILSGLSKCCIENFDGRPVVIVLHAAFKTGMCFEGVTLVIVAEMQF